MSTTLAPAGSTSCLTASRQDASACRPEYVLRLAVSWKSIGMRTPRAVTTTGLPHPALPVPVWLVADPARRAAAQALLPRPRPRLTGSAACAPSTEGSGDVGEVGAQVEHGLGVQLADAALGHAEDATDVGQRQTLEVEEADDDLLPLGQVLHGAGQQLPGLAVLGHGLRIQRAGVLQGVAEAGRAALV